MHATRRVVLFQVAPAIVASTFAAQRLVGSADLRTTVSAVLAESSSLKMMACKTDASLEARRLAREQENIIIANTQTKTFFRTEDAKFLA